MSEVPLYPMKVFTWVPGVSEAVSNTVKACECEDQQLPRLVEGLSGADPSSESERVLF